MTQAHPLRTLSVLFCAALPLCGDTLILRDGQQLDGTLVGASARHVEFLPSKGQTLKVPIYEVESLKFSTPPVATTPKPAPPPQASVILPAGTEFRVRTIDAIDVDVAKAGTKFRASIDDPMMLGGDVIVPRGADVTLVATKVEQGGKMKGSDLIELKVNSIVVRGRAYPVVTTVSEGKSAGEGKKTGRKIVGGAGLGAIIGGIAGGGTGAAIGALAGGAAGTIVSASGQPHLKIPSESRIAFRLTADVRVQ